MSTSDLAQPLNLVVLSGALSSDPVVRHLPSGSDLVQLEVTVDRPGHRADTIPVALFDPPKAVTDLRAGAAVVVRGRVQRRFFRAGGVTQSRTQVTAERVVAAGRTSNRRSLFDRARAALDHAG